VIGHRTMPLTEKVFPVHSVCSLLHQTLGLKLTQLRQTVRHGGFFLWGRGFLAELAAAPLGALLLDALGRIAGLEAGVCGVQRKVR